MNQIFTVTGMTCGHCEMAVKRAISAARPASPVAIDRTAEPGSGRVRPAARGPGPRNCRRGLCRRRIRSTARRAGGHLEGEAARRSPACRPRCCATTSRWGCWGRVARTDSGYRQYTEADVHTLRFIRRAATWAFPWRKSPNWWTCGATAAAPAPAVKRIAQQPHGRSGSAHRCHAGHAAQLQALLPAATATPAGLPHPGRPGRHATPAVIEPRGRLPLGAMNTRRAVHCAYVRPAGFLSGPGAPCSPPVTRTGAAAAGPLIQVPAGTVLFERERSPAGVFRWCSKARSRSRATPVTAARSSCTGWCPASCAWCRQACLFRSQPLVGPRRRDPVDHACC
jgi:hypothetical protein